MSTKRQRVSYGSIDGSKLKMKFYTDAENPAMQEVDTASIPAETQKLLVPYAVNAAFKSQGPEGETAKEAQERFAAFWQKMQAGEWAPGRGSGDGEGPSDLVMAVHTVTGRPLAEVTQLVDPLSPAEKRQLRGDPKVAAAIRDIEMARSRANAKRAAERKVSVLDTLLSKTSAPAQAAE